MTLTVVKVGGSFARSKQLDEIAAQLTQGGGEVVVVPGGGPFAEAVRREQQKIGFDDRAAHKMALLAMVQFGTLLVSRNPRLVPATGPDAIQKARENGRVPVWMPLGLLSGQAHVPESWDMTSDSLAAWFAAQIKAERIIYVKRAAPRSLLLSDLVAAGVLDPLTPRFLASSGAQAYLCGPRNIGTLAEALIAGGPVGRPIDMG